MIIIGFCLIMVVLLDALRRVFKDRRDEVRLNAKISRRDLEDLEDDSFNLLTELPNGGARIVSRTDLQPAFEGQDGEVAQATVEPAVAPSDGPEIKPPDEVPKEDLDEWVQNPSAGSDTELELPSFSARDDDEQPAVDVDPVPLVQDDAPEMLMMICRRRAIAPCLARRVQPLRRWTGWKVWKYPKPSRSLRHGCHVMLIPMFLF